MFNLISPKHLAIGIALLLTAYLSIALKPTVVHTSITTPQLDEMVPKEFAGWKQAKSVELVNPSPDTQQKVDEAYGAIISRTYENPQGVNVMLLVAYGSRQTQKLKVHRQEVCYESQGFSVSDQKSTPIAFGNRRIEATQFFSQKNGRMEVVTYWFTMGDRVVSSRFERMIVGIIDGLSGEIPDGLLVRVSSISTDDKAARTQQLSFISALLGAMDNKYVNRFSGGMLK